MRAEAMFALAGALILTTSVAAGESGPCDPQLLQPAGNPYGYRLRGDRCEGLYVQEVSGAPLVITSWTRTFVDYDLHTKRPLKIEWDSPRGGGDVHLRAQSLRRRLYYRMDATRSVSGKSFSWPSDLLAALQVSRKDVGVVGITRGLAGETEQEIYLPLRIGEGGGAARAGSYQLVLLPGAELKELFLTLTDFAGGKGRVLKNGAPVGYGYYPAERPIEIPISGAQPRGLYRLEVGATLRGGGASAVELWFYHPGD